MWDDVTTEADGIKEVVPLQHAFGIDESANLAAFEHYWERQCPKGDIPRRSQINPRSIEPLLSNAFIIERIASGMARLRIAGLHLSDMMGMEARAMPLSCLIAPCDRAEFGDALVELFDRPARITFMLKAENGFGRLPLTGRMLLLPLRSDLGDISRALGCLVTKGPIGRTPRHFQITGINCRPLSDVIDTAHLDQAIPKANAQLQSSERPYLRIVK